MNQKYYIEDVKEILTHMSYTLIEYDGEGHYQPIRRGSMTEIQALDQLELVKKHDSIKNSFCKNNNIKLLRIPYWEQDNLEYFLFDNFVKMNIITEVA